MPIKLKIILAIIRSKKFMFIVGDGKELEVMTNYTDKEVSKSGKAIYIH